MGSSKLANWGEKIEEKQESEKNSDKAEKKKSEICQR